MGQDLSALWMGGWSDIRLRRMRPSPGGRGSELPDRSGEGREPYRTALSRRERERTARVVGGGVAVKLNVIRVKWTEYYRCSEKEP